MLSLLGLLWWLFNRNNELWPTSTYRVLRAMGLALLDGNGFTRTFPIWGYPSVIAALGILSRNAIDSALPLLQLALCLLVAVAVVWRWLGRWRLLGLLLWLFLMIPVVTYACLRLPDAVILVLLLGMVLSLRNWIETRRVPWLVLGALSAAVAVNTRSEILLFVVGACLTTLVVSGLCRTLPVKLLVRYLAVLSVAALIALIPWAMNSRVHFDSLLLTTTNGPGWFYVGLGQLPNNPWGLHGRDQDAWDFVASKGVEDPFSLAGSRVLTPEIRRLVERYPLAYIKKVGWNLQRAAVGGVYTRLPSRDEPPGRSRADRIRALASLDTAGLAWASQTLFSRTRIFRVAFLLMSILSVWVGVRALTRSAQGWHPAAVALALLCLLYTLFEFGLVSFGYYDTRFMSPLYAVQLAVLANLFSYESFGELLGIPGVWTRARSPR